MFPAAKDLIARDEQIEVDAKKNFYANVNNGKKTAERWRKKGLLSNYWKYNQYFLIPAKVYLPVMMGLFSTVYWWYGLKYYFA